jgi:hypothetical protein
MNNLINNNLRILSLNPKHIARYKKSASKHIIKNKMPGVVARKVSDGKKRAISVKEEEEKEKKKKESSSIRSSSSSYFDSIPDHLKEEIFLRVGSGKSDIGNIQLTSKSFYKVTNSSERFWKTMCEKEVGEEGAIVFREYHFHHHHHQDER